MRTVVAFARYLQVFAAVAILCALSIATMAAAHAENVFYTTSGAGNGLPNGAEIFAIEVSGDRITTTDIGPTYGGDCASLALSPWHVLYSMCGPLFGAQQLATINPTT